MRHVESELSKTETKLAEAREAVAKLEGERAALLERSEHLGAMLHQLQTLSGCDAGPSTSAEMHASPSVPAAVSSKALPFGRALSRPGRARTVALWHQMCLRHCPNPSCPEQPARLRAVVAVLEDVAGAHPSLLSLISSSSEVAAKYISPLVHRPEYISVLERSQPKGWEPPTRLGAASAAAINGSGLVWSH